jgi:hypothetical protein
MALSSPGRRPAQIPGPSRGPVPRLGFERAPGIQRGKNHMKAVNIGEPAFRAVTDITLSRGAGSLVA